MRNPSIKYKHDKDLHKRNKKDHTSISPKAHLASHKTGLTLRDTFGKPTKLNNIQGNDFRNVSTRGPKNNLRLPSILKNPNIPLSSHKVFISLNHI